MSVKYGLNHFKNEKDESISVIIDDGKLREIGIQPGKVNEFINLMYVYDAMGRKNSVPLHEAIIQSISLMSDDMKETFKNNIFGDVDVLPSTITGVVPFILTSEELSVPTDFIIYGKNMCISDTNKTKVSLIDRETGREFPALSWNSINNTQIQATFKIPKTCSGKTLYVSFKLDGVEVESTAEVIVNKDIVYTPFDLEFSYFGDADRIETSATEIKFKPLVSPESISIECDSVVSNDIPDGNFILSADLRINSISGPAINAVDLTRSGFGLGVSGGTGEIRFDSVNLDIRDFKPQFNTFHVKDNINHVKFIKHGKTLLKLLYTDNRIYSYKSIITDSEKLTVCASMQNIDENGIIKSITYSNIKLKMY